jgi:tRNA(fMet)-specific endonuclease VapC
VNLWILDTDSLSLFQRGYPSLTQRVSAITPEEIAITIITVEEQMYGRLNRIRRANSQDALVLAYISLGETLDDLKSINIVEFDQNAANCYAQLQRQKIRIGTQDLRIAAITLSVNGILVTRNRQDFAKVPNLQLEDWTID